MTHSCLPITRFCATVALVCGLSWPVAAAEAQSRGAAALNSALDDIRAGNWDAAFSAADPAGDLGRALVDWHRLRQGDGVFVDYQNFLARHPDWPGLELLQQRGEGRIPVNAVPSEVIDYFATGAPQTGTGMLRLASAYEATGKTGDAEAMITIGWLTLSLSPSEQDAFIDRYGELLKPHHQDRLDMLLWRGLGGEARRLYPRVSEGWQKLAEARITLRDMAAGVDARIEAVPSALMNDPGLAFERFNWRARKGRNESAVELLAERSTSKESLGEPDRWANWRRLLARWEMREGNGQKAYQLASRHYLTEGSDFADLEWLAGYIALTYLDDPKLALGHFQRFRTAVETPISLGRAGYWEGRAHEAMGEAEWARLAYSFGAEYQTSFYGLLAAEKAGLPMDPDLAASGVLPDWTSTDLGSNEVFQASQLLHGAGDLTLSERFSVHLAETLPPEGLAALAAYWMEHEEPHIALMVAKQAASRGITLPEAYYPLADMGASHVKVPPELALAIARRESEFDPLVTSGAGARGLMQLMPRTAAAMAQEVGLTYSYDKLTSDPAYNARLGTAYLGHLIEEFGANIVLVSVGYNAGPSRAHRWMNDRGDPRSGTVDVVDWIEHIPFRETQNYVMRVMESLPVYRARLSGKTEPLALSKELTSR